MIFGISKASSIYLSIFLFLFIYIFIPGTIHAQVIETPKDRQLRLQKELEQVEQEQRETEKILKDAENESSSLKRDILILNTKIKVAELNIKAKNILIESLKKDISNKEKTIENLSDRIERGRETLSQILRKTNDIGDISIPEVLLSKDDLTEVFSDLDTFQSVEDALKKTFEEIRSAKIQTETEKDVLDKRKNQEEDARYAIEQERKNISNNQTEKQRLLNISKNNEKTYSQILAEKRKKANEIRAALFTLRDTASIPFGDALRFANRASISTGVRPAFLLAIITQESSLGANVGSCYLLNTDTGSGISVKNGSFISKVMKPGRDVEPFISITRTLGFEPTKTLVSCPQSVGWGGAMGPAQFIASTWMLFKDRIARALNIDTPNPWNPEDAFMASSIYLGDLGAISGSYTGEQNAACKYYSGKSCKSSSLIRSYGNSVMAIADNIQRNMIDPLQGL